MVTLLAEFLGVKVSADLCADIVEATSFSKMKAGDCSKQQTSLPPAQMYRKGQPVMDGWTGG